MSEKKPENPNVYPDPMRAASDVFGRGYHPDSMDKGMTLLDRFAGMAMQGLYAYGYDKGVADLAKHSYDVAEAMLKEREKRNKQ